MHSTKVNIKDKKADIPGFIIERTSKRIRQSFKKVLKQIEAGITIDQWAILYELEKEDGLNQYEIASRTYKDAPTVTRIIDKLCEKHLTERLADPEDRRRFGIYLTEKGRLKISEVIPQARKFREKVWGDLDDQTVNELIKTLNKVFNNLND